MAYMHLESDSFDSWQASNKVKCKAEGEEETTEDRIEEEKENKFLHFSHKRVVNIDNGFSLENNYSDYETVNYRSERVLKYEPNEYYSTYVLSKHNRCRNFPLSVLFLFTVQGFSLCSTDLLWPKFTVGTVVYFCYNIRGQESSISGSFSAPASLWRN